MHICGRVDVSRVGRSAGGWITGSTCGQYIFSFSFSFLLLLNSCSCNLLIILLCIFF